MSQFGQKWTFKPHPLVTNGHVQSIVGIHWPHKLPPYAAKQHQIQLADGDQLVLHEDAPSDANETTETVLLIHGLGGCHMSTYMHRMAVRLTERGYRVFRKDMRGCGAGESLAKLPTHCGRGDDVAEALHYIAELYPESETSIVGFSMGGTQTMNMLADAGEMRVGNLKRSFVVCPPIDLAHVERHFRTFLGRRYDNFFVRLIWSQVLKRWENFPELAPTEIPKRPKKLRGIDELVIAPAGGFSSAADYYEKASPGPRLKSIKQPLTLVFAADDPVVPIEPLHEAVRNTEIETIITPGGGHLGFLSGRPKNPELRDPDFRWLDWRIVDWLEEGRSSSRDKKSEQKIEIHTGDLEINRPHAHSVGQPQATEST